MTEQNEVDPVVSLLPEDVMDEILMECSGETHPVLCE